MPRLPVLLVSLCCLPGFLLAESTALIDQLCAAQAGRLCTQASITRSIQRAEAPDDPAQMFQVTLAVQQPDQYRLQFRELRDGQVDEGQELFVSDGQTRWHIEQAFADEPPIVSAKPVEQQDDGFLARLRRLLPLDRSELEQEFTLEAEDLGEAGLRLHLVPKDPELLKHLPELNLRFHGPALLLSEVAFRDGQGNQERWQVQSIDHPQALPESLFQVQP